MKIINFRDLPDKRSAHNFITHSFLKSLRESPQYENVSDAKFFPLMNRVVNWLLDQHMKGRMQVKLAIDDNDASYFFAYIIYMDLPDRNHVYYLYTKHLYRNEGIAKNFANKYLIDYPIEYHFVTRKFLSWMEAGKNEHYDLRRVDQILGDIDHG